MSSSKKYPQHQIVSLRRAQGGIIVNNALYMMEPSKMASKPIFPPTGQQNLFSEGDTHLIEEMQKIGNELNQKMRLLEKENLFVSSTDLKVIQKYADNLRKKCEALEMKIKTSI